MTSPALPPAVPPVGSRVVMRHVLPASQRTDTVVILLSPDEEDPVVDGKRGIERISRGTVVAAKQVPPPPEPRGVRS